MAEFCLDCWNAMGSGDMTEEDVILSTYPEQCEGCGETKLVIEIIREGGIHWAERQETVWLRKSRPERKKRP
jgi:hypothetical protein